MTATSSVSSANYIPTLTRAEQERKAQAEREAEGRLVVVDNIVKVKMIPFERCLFEICRFFNLDRRLAQHTFGPILTRMTAQVKHIKGDHAQHSLASLQRKDLNVLKVNLVYLMVKLGLQFPHQLILLVNYFRTQAPVRFLKDPANLRMRMEIDLMMAQTGKMGDKQTEVIKNFYSLDIDKIAWIFECFRAFLNTFNRESYRNTLQRLRASNPLNFEDSQAHHNRVSKHMQEIDALFQTMMGNLIKKNYAKEINVLLDYYCFLKERVLRPSLMHLLFPYFRQIENPYKQRLVELKRKCVLSQIIKEYYLKIVTDGESQLQEFESKPPQKKDLFQWLDKVSMQTKELRSFQERLQVEVKEMTSIELEIQEIERILHYLSRQKAEHEKVVLEEQVLYGLFPEISRFEEVFEDPIVMRAKDPLQGYVRQIKRDVERIFARWKALEKPKPQSATIVIEEVEAKSVNDMNK